ncbi:MAG: hypothetical protein J6Z11_01210, partial [Candidatus Riflebacteria bacterium]|nr:hypothetical protein [Candidatus Riflebacteria bacterium]
LVSHIGAGKIADVLSREIMRVVALLVVGKFGDVADTLQVVEQLLDYSHGTVETLLDLNIGEGMIALAEILGY